MSQIDELIEKLCPNGVEYKKTKELKKDSFWLMPATPYYISDGIPYITSKNIKDGKINFENVNYISQEDYINISANRKIERNDLLVTMIGTIGETAFVEDNTEFYGQNMYLIRLDDTKINRKFFNYYLTSPKVKNLLVTKRNISNQGYIKAGNLEELSIPVPPLEIQNEIVNIFDKFTELLALLKAELKARKKQYSYYREKLFENLSDNKKLKIEEFAKCYAGATPSTSNPNYWKNGTIDWMSSGEVNYGQIYKVEKKITQLGYDSCSTKILPKNTVVVALAGQGKTRGTVAIIRIELCTNQSLCGIIPNNEIVDNEYLYYYLQSKYLDLRKISSGECTRGGLNLKTLKNYEILIPPIEDQRKIATILNKFDQLCNSLTEGIPAEIEARQKQYEYYRDKLLTFKELGSNK